MRVLDLFSGIGGFSLGLERAGMITVAFCEIEPFCRRVLAKHWPEVPCYDDVRSLTGARLAADGISVDVICGGFPCQDISVAGKGAGLAGERSGLWREYARLVGEIRPRFVIVENVAALLARGLGAVLGDLAALGYDAEWHCIPASAVGAPHRRDRLWIVGYPNDQGEPTGAEHDEAPQLPQDGCAVHAKRRPPEMALQLARIRGQQQPVSWDRIWGAENPPLGMGVDDGVPQRLDRLRALGNAVVPQISELIGRAIMRVAA